MKHVRLRDLGAIRDLLTALRRLRALVEKTPGVFFRGGAAFLHFHEDTAGIFADIRVPRDWKRLPVKTAAQREAVLRVAAAQLAAPPAPPNGRVRPAKARRKQPKIKARRTPRRTVIPSSTRR